MKISKTIIIFLLLITIVTTVRAEEKCMFEVGWLKYNQFEKELKRLKFYGLVDYEKSSNGPALCKDFYVTIYDIRAREYLEALVEQMNEKDEN